MSGNEPQKLPSMRQYDCPVQREPHRDEDTLRTKIALSPYLQGKIDQMESDHELYDDSWINPKFVSRAYKILPTLLHSTCTVADGY
jgi:hypothetical protein